jgi:hypothetical protein
MGLGVSNQENTVFLNIAGGYIWQKKDANGNAIAESHPQFRAQEYEFSGEKKTRSGAQYDDFTGKVVRVEIADGTYGEQLKVTMESGGEKYTFSTGTNNIISQHFMSALLVMDLNEPIHLKPYDFEGRDRVTKKPTGKRVRGITFKQGGQKLELKAVAGLKEFDKAKGNENGEIYTQGSKKIKRYFEDLNDWYVEQVKMKVVPVLVGQTPSAKVAESGAMGEVEPEPFKEEPKEIEVNDAQVISEAKAEVPTQKVTPIKMKKFLKEYILENYGEDETLPKLSKDELVDWYNLALNEEELPFTSGEVNEQAKEAEVDSDELSQQLQNLL